MADEPNIRMDEALKAYAGKRRQKAGTPFELHPATHQMLQGEVARTYKQAPRVSWLQRVIVFWPRMAFAAACVAITVTLVLIALPRQRVMEMAQAPGLAGAATRDARLSDKGEAEKLVDAYADASAAAPPIAPAPSIAPVMPSKPLDRLAKNETDDFKAKSEVMTEARKDSNVRLLREESVGKEIARRSYANNAESSRVRYNQQKQDAQLGAKLQNVPPILNNFDLEQTGDKVRVIDEDGSIYVGNFVSSDEAKKLYNKRQQNAPSAPRAAGEQQTLFFAFGTNVTLKQEVSIEANILQVTNAVATGALAPAQALRQDPNERGKAQNTIRGRARVGTNQEVFINAVPSQP